MDLIFAIDSIIVLMYIYWFYKMMKGRGVRLYIGKSSNPVFFLLVWSMFAIVPSVSKLSSIYGVFLLAKAILLYFYIINNVTTKKKLIVIVNVLIIIFAVQATIGVLQKINKHSIGLYFFGERKMSFDEDLDRIRGTLGFPNMYGTFLAFLFPMVISMIIYTRNKLKRALYLIFATIGIAALYLSLSRQSWLGFSFSILVMVFLLIRRTKLDLSKITPVLIVILLIICFGAIFWDKIMLRLNTGGQGEYRLLMINIALQILQSHPILGVGLFNYQFHSFSIFSFWQPVHNTYLRLACETGLPGLFFYLWFLLLLFKDLLTAFKFNDKLLSFVALGLIGGFTAFCVITFFGPQYQHYRHKVLFWLLAGLAISLKRIYRREIIMNRRAKFLNNSSKAL